MASVSPSLVQLALPRGLVKIRSYGIYASSHITTKVPLTRSLLGASALPDRGARGEP